MSMVEQKTYEDGTSKKCEYLWPTNYIAVGGVENKYLFNKWITSIIFSALILVCDIGLAIFGFFLFSGGSDSNHVPVK